MPKSKIIKDVANDIADLETSLNRLFLLASDISDQKTMEWVEKELQGYSPDDDLPEYRKTTSLTLRYSGIANQFQVTNVALQPDIFSKEQVEAISEIKISDSIKTVIGFASAGKDIERDLSWMIDEVFRRSGGHIQCTHISQIVPFAFLQNIISSIKHRLIQELIALEKQYGCLDSLEIQSEEDPENVAFWNNIHERIKLQAKEYYTHNYFDPAAERAVREVETRLRELFRELKPEAKEPSKINDIVGALLTENGAFHYCDITTPDGMNYCRGFSGLVQSFFTAYRNPLSHTNHTLTKRDAFELISLSSLIMEVLCPESIS